MKLEEPQKLLNDFDANLRIQVEHLKKNKASLEKWYDFIQSHPQFWGQLLCILSWQIAKRTKNKTKALEALREARYYLTDNHSWLKHCLLKEFGIRHFFGEKT